MTIIKKSYTQLEKEVLTLFNNNNFYSLWKNKQEVTLPVHNFTDSYSNSRICLKFPGYKTDYKYNRLVYDYRVDIIKDSLEISTAISHVNIIIDLYNKVLNNPELYNDFRTFLYNLSLNDSVTPLHNTRLSQVTIKGNIPNDTLINEVKQIHLSLNKKHNVNGNKWFYSLEDLAYSIQYIVLQEDINYPMAKGLEGRKMSFARYYEAIFVAINSSHSLEEVIYRALYHNKNINKNEKPKRWFDYNYHLVDAIR